MKLRTERRGNVCVLVTVCVTLLLGVAAFAIDGGLLQDNIQRLQSTADASALAAANQLYYNSLTDFGLDPQGKARAAAERLAVQNGFPSIQVRFSPSTYADGPNKGQIIPPGYVEVIISHSQPRYFSRLYGSTNIALNARAVARGLWRANKNGILVLDPTSSAALKANGGGTVSVAGAPLIVNSRAADGGTATGGGTVTAPELYFGGVPGYGGSGNWNGDIKNNQVPTPDPLGHIPEPDPSTMTQYNKVTIAGTSIVTIYPGAYKNGISVSGQGTLIMMPGIYYMDGGGFSFSGQGSLLAEGVMVFNAPKSNSDTISISGSGNGGTITLSPPTSGLYQGISLFQQRSSTNTITVSGNGSTSLTGTFYTARGTLDVTGNGSSDTIGSQYISYKLTTGGNGNFTVNWDMNLVARERVIGLVE